MKQTILLLLSLCLLFSRAAAEEDWLNIQQLRRQTPARWTHTYETPWRDVHIDAPIFIPQADELPALLVKRGVTQAPTGSADERVRSDDGYHFYLSRETARYPGSLNGRRLNRQLEAGAFHSGGADAALCYVPLCDLPFSGLCGLIGAEMLRLGFDPDEYTFRAPHSMRTQHMYYQGEKRDALPGAIHLDFRYQLSGVPVLGHIWHAVADHTNGESRSDEFKDTPSCYAVYNGYADRLTSLALWRAEPEAVLARDLPLRPLSSALKAVEAEILAGRIRSVLDVELGYVLFNPPGVYRAQNQPAVEGRSSAAELASARRSAASARANAHYCAKPMWMISCLYTEDPQRELRGIFSSADNGRSSLYFRQFLADAQTGGLICESAAFDRCEWTGFLSWDEARLP